MTQSSEPAVARLAAVAACALIAASVVLSLAYWPGVMTWDSIRQYGQAVSGRFDDWHPPLMNWMWRQLLPIARGPAPMLVLQLGVYAAGWGLFAGWALKRRRPILALAVAAASLMPIAVALMGTIIKDSLMAALLLAAAGLLACRREGRDLPLRLLAAALIVLASCLRFNAFLAGGPLLVPLLPEALRRTPLRTAAAGLVASAALLLPMPIANHLLNAEKSGVQLSLVIFDLGGITEHSGKSVFPLLPVKDPVAANHACYSPIRWDPYADWAETPCPVGFDAVRPWFAAHRVSPMLCWARAALTHPIAYAQHRLTHFNINARFLVHDEIERPVHDRSEDNDWGFQVTPNPLLRAVDALARRSAETPLGWPIVWIALAAGVLAVSWRLTSRGLVVPMALSSLMYGLGYGVFSVSSELRYHLWTMIAALIAACVAVADLAAAPRRRDWLLLTAPPAVVAILAAAARLAA